MKFMPEWCNSLRRQWFAKKKNFKMPITLLLSVSPSAFLAPAVSKILTFNCPFSVLCLISVLVYSFCKNTLLLSLFCFIVSNWNKCQNLPARSGCLEMLFRFSVIWNFQKWPPLLCLKGLIKNQIDIAFILPIPSAQESLTRRNLVFYNLNTRLCLYQLFFN